MTKVTVQTPAIRGKLTLAANEENPTLFIAVGNAYKPMELSANTMGEAVDRLMSNIHRLQLSDEARIAKKAKSEQMKATMAKYHGKPKTTPPRTAVPQQNIPEAKRAAS